MYAVDPVCGMQVKIQKTALRSEYRGQTYYFCTISCRNAFDAHQEKYILQGFSHSGNGGYEYQKHG
jgi:Cu+-exporting ATPase